MTCPRCGNPIVHPDYRHGHQAVCGACDQELYERREAKRRHPAKGALRPLRRSLRAVGVGSRTEYLGHHPDEASRES